MKKSLWDDFVDSEIEKIKRTGYWPDYIINKPPPFHPVPVMKPNQESQISPIYILSIVLSIPAGVFLGFHFDFKTLAAQVICAGIPPLLVVTIAYFHTRHRNKKNAES